MENRQENLSAKEDHTFVSVTEEVDVAFCGIELGIIPHSAITTMPMTIIWEIKVHMDYLPGHPQSALKSLLIRWTLEARSTMNGRPVYVYGLSTY